MSLSDPKAERTLVLSIVAHPESYDYITSSLLSSEHFTDDLARRIYGSVVSLIKAGVPVSATSVQNYLVEKGLAGSAVAGWNKGAVVSKEECLPLANRVRDTWELRELSALGDRIPGICESNGTAAARHEIEAVLEKTNKALRRPCKSILDTTADYCIELDEAIRSGKPISFLTGFKGIDKATGGFRPGELVIVAARPGNAKSSFIMSMLYHFAITCVNAAAFWLEDDWHDAVRRFQQLNAEIKSEAFREPKIALELLTRAYTLHQEAQSRLYIDDEHGLTIDDICARMRRMYREHGTKIFVADHLGEIIRDPTDKFGERHDLARGVAARRFRDCAKELGAVPILVSQMNRYSERRDMDSAKPQLSDIDGSGQVEQAARIVIFLKLNHGTRELNIRLEKNMNGPTGNCSLQWIPERMVVANP